MRLWSGFLLPLIFYWWSYAEMWVREAFLFFFHFFFSHQQLINSLSTLCGSEKPVKLALSIPISTKSKKEFWRHRIWNKTPPVGTWRSTNKAKRARPMKNLTASLHVHIVEFKLSFIGQWYAWNYAWDSTANHPRPLGITSPRGCGWQLYWLDAAQMANNRPTRPPEPNGLLSSAVLFRAQIQCKKFALDLKIRFCKHHRPNCALPEPPVPPEHHVRGRIYHCRFIDANSRRCDFPDAQLDPPAFDWERWPDQGPPISSVGPCSERHPPSCWSPIRSYPSRGWAGIQRWSPLQQSRL